ncbi:MAG: hypothetical protein SFX18_16790 [Pirellulales bacterium]|nr:hypothetical protein [Pirellulales bacterium]
MTNRPSSERVAAYQYLQSPRLAEWVEQAGLNNLGPGKRQSTPCEQLGRLELAELLAPRPIVQKEFARSILAGLLLLYDGLEESHTISQSLNNPTGSYWHGIMHRREPDPGNAKYWFDRVGPHPIHPLLCQRALPLFQAASQGQTPPQLRELAMGTAWLAAKFVDLCQYAERHQHSSLIMICQQAQRLEMELLLDYCYRQAMGLPD